MSDNLLDKGAQDRRRVSLSEPWEVVYWTNRFNCSEQRLRQAVAAVGNSVSAVERQINK